MASAQVQPNLSWVDEEVRQLKTLVGELKELVQNQSIVIGDQANRIRELHSRLEASQAQFQRITQVEESLQQAKSEMAIILQEFRDQQRKLREQTEEAHRKDNEAHVISINRLSQELTKLPRLEGALEELRAEDRRLNEATMKLQSSLQESAQKVTAQIDRISLLDSAQQKEREGISRLSSQVEQFQEQVASHTSRLAYLEQWGEKSATLVTELQSFRTDLETARERAEEVQRQEELRRQKQMAEWARKMEILTHNMDLWADRMRLYGDQNDKSRNTVRDMQELAKQLRYEQEQMRQLQEIFEDQQRRELREWQGENEKRWTQHLNLWQFHLDKQSKLDTDQTGKLDGLEASIKEDRETMDQIAKRLQEHRSLHLAEIDDLWKKLNLLVSAQIETWQDTLEACAKQTATRELPPESKLPKKN